MKRIICIALLTITSHLGFLFLFALLGYLISDSISQNAIIVWNIASGLSSITLVLEVVFNDHK